MSGSFFDNVYSETRFNWKQFIQTLFPGIILALFIFVVVWTIDYFNPLGEINILNYITHFLVNYWLFLVLFVFVFSVWDYLFKIYYDTILRYAAPFFNSVGILFAIWIIATIFNGLKFLLEEESSFVQVFAFLHDFFYAQTLLLFCLILLIHYSRFFLNDRIK